MRKYPRILGLLLIASAATPSITSAAQIPDDQREKITAALPESAPAPAAQPRRLLVFSKTAGFRHSSIPVGVEALRMMGAATGAYAVEHSEDEAVLAADNLERFDAICFLNTTGTLFTDPQLRDGLLRFVREGKGLVGIHAATDAFYDWEEYARMMGGWFHGHPWHEQVTLKVENPQHALCRCFDGSRFEVVDEIYQFRPEPYSRNVLRVLTSLDTSLTDMSKGGVHRTDGDFAVSWVRRYGDGRVFYCSLGHREDIYWNPTVLAHYLAGIQFAFGDLEADTTPSAETMLEETLARFASAEWGSHAEERRAIASLVRSAAGRPEKLAEYERAFVQVLENPSASVPAKDFLCRFLQEMGSAESVPILALLLERPSVAVLARRALQHHPAPEAGRALRAALDTTRGELRRGVIRSLGERAGPEASAAIAKVLRSADPAEVEAAIAALGRIADAEALAALEGVSGHRDATAHAQLACAEALSRAGVPGVAERVWTRWLDEPAAPRAVRVAAMEGLLRVRPQQALERLEPWLSSSDPRLHAAAAGQIRRLPVSVSLPPLLDRLPRYPTSVRAVLLGAFADRRLEACRPALIEGLGGENPALRSACVEGLGRLGGAASVPSLLAVASNPDDGLQPVASRTLAGLHGDAIDEALLAVVDGDDAASRAAALGALTARRAALGSRLSALLADRDRAVRIAALNATRTLGDAAHFHAVLYRLREADHEDEREATARCLTALWPRLRDHGLAAAELAAVMAQLTTEAQVAALEEVSGFRPALPIASLRPHLNAANPRVRSAAVKALAEWRDPAALPEQLEFASAGPDAEGRVEAINGWLRLLRDDVGDPLERAVRQRAALARCTDVEVRRRLLGELARSDAPASLRAIGDLLSHEALAGEAARALGEAAARVADLDPLLASWVARRLQAVDADEARETSRRLLASLERWSGFVPSWRLAGPYLEKGVGAAGLIDQTFAPETRVTSIRWATAMTEADAGRSLNLQAALGGNDRAAYLEVEVYAPSQVEARLEIGSDDGVKAWLNRSLVHRNAVNRGYQPGQDRVDVTLEEGWNTLLLKVVNGGGGWAAGCRVVARDGAPLQGLEFRVDR